MAYGRHQSFYAKSNWINKGIKALKESENYLTNKTHGFKYLGIGKNMFISLNHWLLAFNIVEISEGKLNLTEFGEYIEKFDLACKNPFTLNLLHYYLTLENPINSYEISNSFYFLFNKFINFDFTKDELIKEIIYWDTAVLNKNTSPKSIIKDVDCLIQTYTKTDKSHPEDLNTSILADLFLLKKERDIISKVPIRRKNLSLDAFFYVLLRFSEYNNEYFLSFESIENDDLSPGKIYNLSRIQIIDILEEMIAKKYPIKISRTNNLDMLVLTENNINSQAYIKFKFKKGAKW